MNRRTAIFAAITAAAAAGSGAGAPLEDGTSAAALSGGARQGGVVLGRAPPLASIALDGQVMTQASNTGLFVVGFDRDAPPRSVLSVRHTDGWRSVDLDIARVSYDVQKIDGLPPQMVTPTDPGVLAREASDRDLKTKAFLSRAKREDFADGFTSPIDNPVRTSPFGVQRVLNGEPKAPHYGVDLAAPTGASIRAPAAGLVILAEPDLYLDGGLTLIDHGQGLISAYLHQSRLDVRSGDLVQRGEVIGAVGMRGRATGPHLCWRLKWRDRNLDPSSMIGMTAPSLAEATRTS